MTDTKKSITKEELRELIAKKAIELVNKYEFSERNGVSSSNLRNLLNFSTSSAVSPNQFILFAKYQATRKDDRVYSKFTNDFLNTAKELISKIGCRSIKEKMEIYKELLISIVMGGTFRKNAHEKIEAI
ncbi:MAG: hypothetical protein K9W44_00590 [Candidatus Lokiarchaeota archaeon]|nr:hypothetical protein [Candidatus Harpocratesius repetitus]